MTNPLFCIQFDEQAAANNEESKAKSALEKLQVGGRYLCLLGLILNLNLGDLMENKSIPLKLKRLLPHHVHRNLEKLSVTE